MELDVRSNDTTSFDAIFASVTPHAAVRMQQRGLSREVLDCLVRYGRREYDHHGCEVAVFDEAALLTVARNESVSLWRKAVGSRSVYAVIDSDGHVVTAGHRFRRVQRDRSISSYRPGRSRRPRRFRGALVG
jgi:hypothetical protein